MKKIVFNHTVFSHLLIHQITVDGYSTCRDFVLAKSDKNKVGQCRYVYYYISVPTAHNQSEINHKILHAGDTFIV